MAKLTEQGFILSKQQFDRNGVLVLCYWLKTPVGQVRLLVEGQESLFFVSQAQRDRLEKLLTKQGISHRIGDKAFLHFSQAPHFAVYFASLSTYFSARDVAKEHGITLYEDDIRHCDRYLMERHIRAAMWFSGNAHQRDGYIQVTQARCKSSNYRPQLKPLSLDIECNGQGVLFSIGLYGENGYSKVLMIGAEPNQTQVQQPTYIEWVRDEISLLQYLEAAICDYDPDVIIGWNVVDFDFVVLAKRAESLGCQLKLGRGASNMRYRPDAMQAVTLAGRALLDGIKVLKNASYHFISFSLAQVSEELLGDKKLITAFDSLAEIERLYQEDKPALAAYNLQDCKLVWDIFEKEQLIAFTQARAEMTGLDLERLGGSVAAFINLYLPWLHRQGYIAPNLGEQRVSFSSPGGYVMESKPGLYKNVIVLDYKSLYPSIIKTYLIDPLGLVIGLSGEKKVVSGFNGALFSVHHHFLPELVGSLWQRRDIAKANNDKTLSYAIKIIMNSLYGVLGSTGCRFYDPRLSSSITLRGHEIMQTTKTLIENKGYTVIYGDTDSTFVQLPDNFDAAMCDMVGQQLAQTINQHWQEAIAKEFGQQSALEIEFETQYSPFFMPTLRGSDLGSKKRYVGLSGDQLVIKGMEAARGDWTALARDFQQSLYLKLFNNEPLKDFVLSVNDALLSGQLDDKLMYRKRLGQALHEYTKNVPPQVKAVQKAQLIDPEFNVRKGNWIEYVMTENGAQMCQFQTSNFDYEHYLEKQLKPIFDAVSLYAGLTFDQIVSKQKQLL